jgi:hypothetical protein
MRLTLRTQVATLDDLQAVSLLYVLTCRLDVHPNDRERVATANAPAWNAFLARQQTTADGLMDGVTWSFATEAERETVATSVRSAVQALTEALGVHTLTPVEDPESDT